MHISRVALERLVVAQTPSRELTALQTHLQKCRACQAELVAKLDEEEAAVNSQIDSNTAARIKVLDPITSVGPPAPAHLLSASSQGLHVRVSRSMLVGRSFTYARRSGKPLGRSATASWRDLCLNWSQIEDAG